MESVKGGRVIIDLQFSPYMTWPGKKEGKRGMPQRETREERGAGGGPFNVGVLMGHCIDGSLLPVQKSWPKSFFEERARID